MILKMEPRNSLEELIQRIEYADSGEIDAIVGALKRRYKQLFPDWEVAFLSVPTGSKEAKQEQSRLLIEFIQHNWLEE